MRRIAVIGDTHGCIETTKKLIEQLPSDAEVCFVGDLIDRGPGSKDLIDLVIKNNYHCVLGNHEDMLLESLYIEDGILRDYVREMRDWISNGGDKFLLNYGITYNWVMDINISQELKDHFRFIEKLPIVKEFKDVVDSNGRHLVVSHSSVDTMYGKEDDPRYKNTVIWNRYMSINDIPGVYNVFGHTPVIKPIIKGHYANIDTGAVYSKKDGGGILTALLFPDMITYTQERIDEV